MLELFSAVVGGTVGWGGTEHPWVPADAKPGSSSGDSFAKELGRETPALLLSLKLTARSREMLGGTCRRTEAEEQENGSGCWRRGGNKAGVGG